MFQLKFRITSVFILITLVHGFAQDSIQINSPNQLVKLHILNTNDGALMYRLTYKNKKVIEPSRLGFLLKKPNVPLTNFTLIRFETKEIKDTWHPVWGERSTIVNHYHEVVVMLKDNNGSGIFVNIFFRVYDDGIGFRYEFPRQKSLQHFIVADEYTQFNLVDNHRAFWIPGDYETNEYAYNTTRLSEIDALAASQKEKDIALTQPVGKNVVQTPLMLKSNDGLYINIHEAALRHYPVMQLDLNKETFTFSSHLVPDAVGNKAYLETPAQTPWRTIIVSDKATDILASNMIVNLNEPSVIKDVSWIKPQKYVGVWWAMHIGKATWQYEGGKHGAYTQHVKTYIDFAAQHGFDGVLVEGWNTGWEDWFGNWKEDVFDFVTPYPDYHIQELTDYARSKGVNIIMHHETSGSVSNYERLMDTAYRFMLRYGMNTVKTGYVGRIIPRGEHHDGQWMVNHYERVAQKTAQYHIMTVAHESAHPTGLHRTYPNWLANEAARGSEFHNAPTWGMSPDHTTILPFTRGVGGPMDFTPGFFHCQLNQFDSTRHQQIRSTLAKQLALYVTMYSPVQMVPDLPENYQKYPDAFQFIVDVATDWVDTHILEAEPGEYITIARKAKQNTRYPTKEAWFLGAITDENERQSQVSLSFLNPNKKYIATLYSDADNASFDKAPEAYKIEQKIVTHQTLLHLRLARGGGCAVSLIEQ